MDNMKDRSKAIWRDKKSEKGGRTIVMSSMYLLSVLGSCRKISVDGTFYVMSK